MLGWSQHQLTSTATGLLQTRGVPYRVIVKWRPFLEFDFCWLFDLLLIINCYLNGGKTVSKWLARAQFCKYRTSAQSYSFIRFFLPFLGGRCVFIGCFAFDVVLRAHRILRTFVSVFLNWWIVVCLTNCIASIDTKCLIVFMLYDSISWTQTNVPMQIRLDT